MARYVCLKDKKVTIQKANEYCLLQRCPELAVRKPIFEKGKLKHIIVPVVLVSLADVTVECEDKVYNPDNPDNERDIKET